MFTGKDTLKDEDTAIVLRNSPLEGKKKKKGKGIVTIDEIIEIPHCDPRALSPEELKKYGELCQRKEAQEKLKQTKNNNEILIDVQDILQQVIPDADVDEKKPIMDQLATLTQQIQKLDIDLEK